MNAPAQNRYQRTSGALCRVLVCVVFLLVCVVAHGSVAVLLEEPYGEMGRMNPTGHSAVYFDRICAESPTTLRPCRADELGVVISRYDGIDGYDWLAMPVIPYLYAVDSSEEIPTTIDRAGEADLRNAYRRAHLQSIAPDLPDGGEPGGNWYELAGSAYDRSIYAFQVDSTPEQEAKLIALFNDSKNIERYNGAFRNCADFTRVTINRFYPRAIRRNFVADFGLTTPKSVARALAHYAKKHPETNLRVYKIPQVKGEIPRSRRTKGIAESLLKNYGVPLVLISPVTASVVLAAYIQHGRFGLPKNPEIVDFRQSSSVLVAAGPASGSTTSPPGGLKSEASQELSVEVDKVIPFVGPSPTGSATPASPMGDISAGGMYPGMVLAPVVLPGDFSFAGMLLW